MPGGLAGGMQVRHQDQAQLLRCSSHGTACAWVAVNVDRHGGSDHEGEPAAHTRQATSLGHRLSRPEDRQGTTGARLRKARYATPSATCSRVPASRVPSGGCHPPAVAGTGREPPGSDGQEPQPIRVMLALTRRAGSRRTSRRRACWEDPFGPREANNNRNHLVES